MLGTSTTQRGLTQALGAMRHTIVRRLLIFAIWLSPLVAGWHFLGDWLAPDACLDFGGAFDYVNWRCSHDDNEVLKYIDVPAYQLPSFQIFAGCIVIAIALHMALRRSRLGA